MDPIGSRGHTGPYIDYIQPNRNYLGSVWYFYLSNAQVQPFKAHY